MGKIRNILQIRSIGLCVCVCEIYFISYYLLLLDYKSHPCIRECKDGAPPMTCRYAFVLELYHSMSKACHNCPLNITECAQPHCVAGDGSPRPILTANRMVPGPAIHVSNTCLLYVEIKAWMFWFFPFLCNIYLKPRKTYITFWILARSV